MKAFIIHENDAGQRLDRFLKKALPHLPQSLLQKSIRVGNIKVNRKKPKREQHLISGDVVQVYLSDEWFQAPVPPAQETAFLRIKHPPLFIVYEDDHLLIVDKPPGLPVQPDKQETVHTLINYIKAYLYETKQWDPKKEQAFTPALCHRIDRNTGGLVIAAKTAEALRVMNQKIRDREIEKYYFCVVYGVMHPKEGVLTGYLKKDSRKNKVDVLHQRAPGALFAQTEYRTLEKWDGLSLVECRLITGRTHQIRAQFSDAGHPLLGDGKYGSEKENRKRKQKWQALYAARLVFSFSTPAGCLDYLKGAVFQGDETAFRTRYFPNDAT
ncbi:MAG: RluA family pseudouridine synthase [Oscillospiraceae bacterium]|nr:RluA family pseudouridine synthase [Oscillospiraceae bacterium]